MLAFLTYVVLVALSIYIVQGTFKSDFWKIGFSIFSLIAPGTTIIISLIVMFVTNL